MKNLLLLFLASSLISCQTYKEKLVLMHPNSKLNKQTNKDCFWLQSIVNKSDIGHKSEKIHLHYCCPNKDIDNKMIIPV